MRKFVYLGLLAALFVSSAHAANRPKGYVTICKEGAACTVNTPTKVAFGRSDRFFYRDLNGRFICNEATFGGKVGGGKNECSIARNAASSNSSSSSKSSSSVSSVSSSISSNSSSVSSSVASSSSSSAASSSSVSSSAQSSASSSVASSAAAYTAVTTQYVHEGITTANSLYMDSAHFRVYYGGNGRNGGGILGTHTTAQITQVLDYLEAAHDYWITQRGFRSPGQPVAGHSGGPFKINVYAKANIDAGGYMGFDGRSGLSFVIVNSNSIAAPSVYVHEFGHCITLSEYLWVDKAVTGAWWEATAQWHTDDFLAFAPQHAATAARQGRASASTIFDLNTVVGNSHLTLVHANNLYQAWPFLSYLNANPDGYSGLGVNAVRTLYRSHQGSQTETPLHTLARMVSSTTWQRVVGSYWARMAYLDIKHPLAQQRLMASINNASFRASAYRNLSAAGTNTYRVITARQPMYGGANINPLTLTASNIGITVKNLGNGLADSNFTATLAIRNTANGSVRYVQLPNGAGSASIASGEEVSLVVANTPNNLYTYNAFESTSTSPDRIGLNYEVVMTGARPRDL